MSSTSAVPLTGLDALVHETAPVAPALLTMASYSGTLAAARCLGAHGVPVTVADPDLLAMARWSRHATRRVFCPPVQRADRFLPWLLEFGRRFPGHVLYPTSDDTAWLYALHAGELGGSFRLYQPPVEALYTLLNKRRLRQACTRAGIECPRTAFPQDASEVRKLGAEVGFPLIIKPQTQILFWPHAKGALASSPEDLAAGYEGFVRRTAYARAVLEYDPGVAHPMLQAYVPGAAEGIYNLSGFVDESGDLFAVRASRKVLQRPRRLGVGLCFQEASVDPSLAAKLHLLCRQVRYHGVFEAEFVEDRGRFLLIDFNPRYYGQMAFDIGRGLPLATLAHRGALGQREGLRLLLEEAARVPLQARGEKVFCNGIELRMLLRIQRLWGAMAPAELARWRSWLQGSPDRRIDAILDREDRGPAVAKVMSELLSLVRHPRSTLGHLASGK